MAETILDGTTFDINNIMYTNPKANDKGGKSINILNKHTKTGLRLTTPLMLTWGAAEYVDKNSGEGNGKYDISLQFPQSEYSNAECNAFFKNMVDLEQKIKNDALSKSKEWFGTVHKSPDIIDVLFTPMLKYPKIKNTSEPDYSKRPTLRMKLPQWEGVWKTEIYDEDGQPLFPNKNLTITPLDYLKKGSTIACVIQCGGIWFTNGKFTVTWKLLQAVVQKPRDTIQGKCMINLKSTDKEKLKNADPGEENHTDTTTCAVVMDSDEEPDDEPQLQQAQEQVKSTPIDATEHSQQDEVSTNNEHTEEVKKKVVRKVVKKT